MQAGQLAVGIHDSTKTLAAGGVLLAMKGRSAEDELAAAEPQHYLVLDATQDRDDLAKQIRARLQPILPKVDL